MQPIIEVKNIGKKYKISHDKGKYVTLRDVLITVIKKPFTFLKTKARSVVGLEKKEEFWALKGVDFTVNPGEVVGIIGHNGAGKSTLLKILSQITPPTEGEIIVRGKIGSLLEVGTGFHPELTGRENIFLNGAILGMQQKDIVEKFDQIVEFADISKFLDTPVKYYSSGMYVRLAFSVAAHMEPDILLVDEVLAVGDVEFQKKCLGKMEQVTRESGRTILFISHNMAAIQSLCQRTVLLEHGKVTAIGSTADIVDQYLSKNAEQHAVMHYSNTKNSPAYIRKISLYDEAGSARTEFPINKSFSVEVELESKEEIPTGTLSLLIYSHDRDLLLYSSEADALGKFSLYPKGISKRKVTIPAFLLNPGKYAFEVRFHWPNMKLFDSVDNIWIEVKNIDNPRSISFRGEHAGRISTILPYEKI